MKPRLPLASDNPSQSTLPSVFSPFGLEQTQYGFSQADCIPGADEPKQQHENEFPQPQPKSCAVNVNLFLEMSKIQATQDQGAAAINPNTSRDSISAKEAHDSPLQRK
eukprot:c14830_g1_i2.p1 GENE.c14830_g1_i2~~c14830_g1_i2.p1  ORF type:complete len:108 (-),score=16.49 c14830_g1_i2:674-997(-)